MALILLFQGCLFGGKAWRDRSMPIGAAAARAQGSCRCRTMEAAAADAAADLRSDFLQVLRSRRRNPDGMHLVMDACPKENVENFKEGLIEENIYLTTEALVLSWKNGDTMPFIYDTVSCSPFAMYIYILFEQFIAEAGIGHQMTVSMVKEASNWLDKFLKD
ncbi:hypothetical protein B296_00047210 [Ensete ventricosum]|uniref:Uncharacterized protein n=1 Tax=Ensete ventricosum TaxID=4639 RepID=A0A426YAW6_ENSVE|nr:hypothetical protein B296_00047210 [Ensete ventricosum]